MNKFLEKKSQKILALIWIIIFVCCIAISNLSLIQQSIIAFVELLIHRPLRNPQKWVQIIKDTSTNILLISSLICLVFYIIFSFSLHKKLIFQLNKEILEWKKENMILNKRNIILLSLVFLIIFFSFSKIIQANYNYIDDLGRNKSGAMEWGWNFGRWVAVLENLALQMNFLIDVSPLNQILSIFLLACAVFILAYVFSCLANEKKISIRFLVSSMIVALNPHFLECISYKYDSLGIATSVLVSIFPFLFIKKKWLFTFSSFSALLLMCLSYQASSGIYIILVLLIGVIEYASKEEYDFRNLIKFYFSAAITYLLALGTYYIAFKPFMHPYRSVEVSIESNILEKIFRNITLYFNAISYDYNWIWSLLLISIYLCATLALILKTSKDKRLFAFILFIVISLAASVLSYGAYIILDDAATSARMIYGFGIFISIMANIAVFNAPSQKHLRILCVPSFILCWLFFVYALGYGNALTEQNEYEKTYEMMILSDLNQCLDNTNEEKYYVTIDGNIGYAPVVHHVIDLYPITSRLIPVMLNGSWYWSGYRLTNYYTDIFSKHPEGYKYDLSYYDLILSRLKYDIYKNDNDIIVKIK